MISFITVIHNAIHENAHNDCYEKDEKKVLHAMDSTSISTIESTITDLEQSRSEVFQNARAIYDDDLSMLRERLEEIREEEWEKRAETCLGILSDNYESIIGRGMENFRDVEQLFQAEILCLRNWKRYNKIDPQAFNLSINHNQYMREWFGEVYDSCMDTYEQLQHKLSEYTDPMKPVLYRKKKLFKILGNYIESLESIKRIDFFKTDFAGYSEQEVKICYRAMIKKNIIVETKKGNRVYISLSDNELERRGKTVQYQNLDGKPLGVADLKRIVSGVQDKYQRDTFPHFPKHVDSTEEKKWNKAAGKHLELFRKYYLILTGDHPGEFDGDLLLKMKDKCIEEWQNYYCVDLGEYQMLVYPKQYLQFWMGNEYDPCMDGHDELERKLLKQVKQMRPEQVRQNV